MSGPADTKDSDAAWMVSCMQGPAVAVSGGRVVASNDPAIALAQDVLGPAGGSMDDLLALIPVEALATSDQGEWRGCVELAGDSYILRLRRAYGIHVLRVDLDAAAQQARDQRSAEYAALGRAVSGLVGELDGVAGGVDGAAGMVAEYLHSMQGALDAVSRVADRAGGWATAEVAAAHAELCVGDLRRAAFSKLAELDSALGVIAALTRAVTAEAIARRAGHGSHAVEARSMLQAAAGLAVMGAGNVRVDLLAGRSVYVKCDRASMVNALATTVAACFPAVGLTRLILSAGVEGQAAVLTVRGEALRYVGGVATEKPAGVRGRPAGTSWAVRPGLSVRLADANMAVAAAGGMAQVVRLDCGGAVIRLTLPLAIPAVLPAAA